MKYIRIFLVALCLVPVAGRAAPGDFTAAAQLLAAAKNADIQQVQLLVNNGANVNYVDSTGLSLVCTALMNKDYRAAQILQMYGADASNCDRQIRQYNQRTKPAESGGLFGGLSSAHTLTLAAGGAALVVGGVLLFSGLFDGGNHNGSESSGGTRPGGDNSGGDTTNRKPAFVLPYGPSLPNANEEATLATAMNYYSPSSETISDGVINPMYYSFRLMNANQNYLLMMGGYASLARGYLGMQTVRDDNWAPVSLAKTAFGSGTAMGGRPINIAFLTDSGINAAAGTSLADGLLPWTSLNGTDVAPVNSETVSSKYYNNNLTYTGTGLVESAFSATEETGFDFSGAGTAIHNAYAKSSDDMIAKIIGGRSNEIDYIGFMPNGQMTVYRTGGGMGFLDLPDGTTATTGTYTMTDGALAENGTIVIGGVTYTISSVDGGVFTATNGDVTHNGYIIGNNLYFDIDGDGTIDQMFAMTATGDGATGGNLTLSKTLQDIDYKNYSAMFAALKLYQAGNNGNRSMPSVIANTSVIEPLRDLLTSTEAERAATVQDMLFYINQDSGQDAYLAYVNQYYNRNDNDGTKPSMDALNLFDSMGAENSPLLVFSTGSFETGANWGGQTKYATFENAAPLAWGNLEHLFMSVVAVGLTGDGTKNATTASGFSPSGKYALSQWKEINGEDTHYFKARKCGIGGSGANGIDPWCFAAAGVTDEYAAAAAAGAAGAVMSAFGRTGPGRILSNKQIFALLALTADGPYLSTDSSGVAFTEATLISYLQSMYQMPDEDEYRWKKGGENYLDVFKDVFGYGLINLERATRPMSAIFYYNGSDIVSASGDAYWRPSARTAFRPSAAFNPRAASISAPFYDILESFDGEMSLPRVWRNEFALGTNGRRGLYMGDTLGELSTRAAAPDRVQMGDIGFRMTASDRAYDDYMGGLDSMTLDYGAGNWKFAGGYQRYFTDGASRFDGRGNPIFALASNAIVSDATYSLGRWSFGARAFSGAVTDEGILQNDPTLASQYMPAELGKIHGASGAIAFNGDKFGFTASVGNAVESETILGAYTDGLLDLGAGNTTYVDAELRYSPRENLDFTLRSTFARTTSDAAGEFILGMTDVASDAFAFGVDSGNFNFTLSMPLAVRRGSMKYAYADYDVVDTDDGRFELNVVDTHVENLALSPENREVRFAGTYRHKLGEFTDGALGFIYRVNPNHTREFGNESIFMMKVRHRVGI